MLPDDLVCAVGLTSALAGCGDKGRLPVFDGGSLSSPNRVQPERIQESVPPLGAGFVRLATPLNSPILVVEPGAPGLTDPEETVGVFADLDGDDQPEVILSSLLSGPALMAPGVVRAVVYRYREGVLVGAPDLQAALAVARDAISTAADLDGDGRLDLLLATNSASTWMPGEGVARWGLPRPLGEPPPGGSPMARLGSIALYDIDADGWLDILGTVGRCASEPVIAYLRTGPGRFDAVPGLFRGGQAEPTALAVWPGPQGPVLVLMGHYCDPDHPHSGFYHQTGRDERGMPLFDTFDPTPDSASYRQQSHSHSFMGSTPMGSATADLDGDGLLDLTVTLGLPQTSVFAGTTTEYFAEHSHLAGLMSPFGNNHEAMIPWGIVPIDLDRDGRLDQVVAHGDDVDSFHNRRIGPQVTATWWNAGGGRFVAATAESRLGEPGNWHSLTVGDLDRDGDPDLIVGGFGPPPAVWRNDIAGPGHAVALRLVGTTSNHLGIGTIVEVETPGAARSVQVVGALGEIGSRSEALVLAGAGLDERVRTIRLRWPSGLTQEVHDVPTGRVVTIEEPRTLTVEPLSRHLAADGVSSARITVVPRNLEGGAREAAVSIELSVGTGTFAGPMTREGESYVRTLVAPRSADSAVIEVRIDGSPLGVRPRVRWD